MTSQIDTTKPGAGNALTSDVRANFTIAANEISVLQAAQTTGTLSTILQAIGQLTAPGVITLLSPSTATTNPIGTFGQSIINTTTSAAARTALALGTAALNNSGDFLASNTNVSLNLLPTMGGANGSVAGTKGMVPAPAATDNVKFLTGAGTFTGLQGTVSGPIVGAFQNVSQINHIDNPRYKFLDNGNSGTAKTIDVSVAQFQKVTLTAGTPVLTLANWAPTNVVYPLVLIVVQDGTGNRVPSFAGATSFKLSGSGSLTFSAGANQVDIFSIFSFDQGATAFIVTAGLNFR